MKRALPSPGVPVLRGTASFTLAEVMVAMTIGMIMMALTIGTSVDLYKDLSAANAYRNIHENARKSLAYLSRDLRAAISVGSVNSTNLQMTVINTSSSGAVITNAIRYYLKTSTSDPTIKVLNRQVSSNGTTNETEMTDHATYVNFEYWSNPGNAAANAGETFEVRASLSITNTSAFRISTDLLQTRVLMRNKHY